MPGYCAFKIVQRTPNVVILQKMRQKWENWICGKHNVQKNLNIGFYEKNSTEPETINNMAE